MGEGKDWQRHGPFTCPRPRLLCILLTCPLTCSSITSAQPASPAAPAQSRPSAPAPPPKSAAPPAEPQSHESPPRSPIHIPASPQSPTEPTPSRVPDLFLSLGVRPPRQTPRQTLLGAKLLSLQSDPRGILPRSNL